MLKIRFDSPMEFSNWFFITQKIKPVFNKEIQFYLTKSTLHQFPKILLFSEIF